MRTSKSLAFRTGLIILLLALAGVGSKALFFPEHPESWYRIHERYRIQRRSVFCWLHQGPDWNLRMQMAQSYGELEVLSVRGVCGVRTITTSCS